MHSIQIKNSCHTVRNFVSFKQSKTQNNKIENKTNNNKTAALTGLSCLGATAAAIVAIRSKNKNAAKALFRPYEEQLYNFKAYLEKAQEANIKTAKDYLANCVEKNILGTGQNSKVYKFNNPIMDNWVIKVNSGRTNLNENCFNELKQIPDEFEGFNMGQPIASFGNEIYILKKINAKPHSIPNWAHHRRSNIDIKPQEADSFLNDIKKIAAFPQEAFDEYAKKLKLLDDKGYKADNFNPNNYLIDYNRKELFIIDFYKYDVDAHINTKYDLFCPLVDYANYTRFYNALQENKKPEFIKTTNILYQKCTKAAENIGLNTSEETFRDYMNRIETRLNLGRLYSGSFDEMKKICSNFINS